ncbi:transcription regulator [hydrocarbon metagenome]|uniref:Transcription regulator n=1 Tax=hydrocarbon metagenome TaxID=938273 RepID=A0A0W8EA26_9ZZZZ
MFVVNPVSAGGRTGKRWQTIEERMIRNGIDNFSVEYTEGPFHAFDISRRAITSGYQIITAVGGDGTINEVLNGFCAGGGLFSSENALSFISTGTGGDFNRMFLTAEETDQRITSILHAKREKACDIVKAKYLSWKGDPSIRYYINVADLGLGGETCVRINRGGKFLGGFLSFLTAVLVTLAKHHSFEATVNIDQEEIFSGKLTELALANGRFFGGGMMIAPDAEIDDGRLDIILIEDMKKLELLRCLPQVYSGKHRKHPKVKMYKGQKIEIACDQKVWLEMDGETPGTSDLSIELIPGAVRFVF